MMRPSVICLTPIKDESWILDTFLKCASLWADHIIIADQLSDDGSRDIAGRYPKVILIDNQSPNYNELERQKLLLDAARRIAGPRLFVALDADEVLSANFMSSVEWRSLQDAEPGTVVFFQRVGVLPDFNSYWIEDTQNLSPFGLLDDGSEHIGSLIHSKRLPFQPNSPRIEMQDVKVLHYQYSDWARMESKHRWYQCWERVNRPARRATAIYRQYHHMDAILRRDLPAIPDEWLRGYQQEGIDMTNPQHERVFRWDREVIDLLVKHGRNTFKREAIWDVNWSAISRATDLDLDTCVVRDPRTAMDRAIHYWLRVTQPYSFHLPIRLADVCLRLAGW